MAEIRSLPTLAKEVDSEVLGLLEHLRMHVEAGEVSGLVIGVTFRDGRSWTEATKGEDRLRMLGLLLEGLINFQRETRP